MIRRLRQWLGLKCIGRQNWMILCGEPLHIVLKSGTIDLAVVGNNQKIDTGGCDYESITLLKGSYVSNTKLRSVVFVEELNDENH